MDDPRAAALARCAARLREVYYAERNRWHREHDRRQTNWGTKPYPPYDGGTDAKGRRYADSWAKLARFVTGHGVEPARYVRAHFRVRAAHPPEPGHLMTAGALAVYDSRAEADVQELARLFEFQKQQMRLQCAKLKPCRTSRGWSDADIVRAVLGTTLHPLSALFRYCLAEREGYADLAECFRPEALAQYLAQPADYDRVWGEWLPAGLRGEAHALVAYARGLDPRPREVGPAAPAPAGPPAPKTDVRTIIRD